MHERLVWHMKATGIIAEYNPFHGGHQYHIEKAKERTDSQYCVAVMSGDFVQRGEPAIFSKYLRTKMALTCGADVVIELPSLFASSSAEDFAACGIALLTALGTVDTVCFGSEDGNIDAILSAASLLEKEDLEFSQKLKKGLRQGLSWPQARNAALISLSGMQEKALNRLLGSPNNLLGIEYCKAIKRQESPLTPVTILRNGQGYHDSTLDGAQASASALRKALLQKEEPLCGLFPHIPPEIQTLYGQGLPLSPKDCSSLLNYTLLTMLHEGRDLTLYADMSQELADRLKHCLLQYEDWEGRIRQLKTRQYTYTRISRALLQLMLGVTKEMREEGKEAGFAPYARILGFRKSALPLLSQLKKDSSIPLITKTAGAESLLTGTAIKLFKQDLYASHVRQCLEAEKYGSTPRNEYNQPICIL